MPDNELGVIIALDLGLNPDRVFPEWLRVLREVYFSAVNFDLLVFSRFTDERLNIPQAVVARIVYAIYPSDHFAFMADIVTWPEEDNYDQFVFDNNLKKIVQIFVHFIADIFTYFHITSSLFSYIYMVLNCTYNILSTF